MHKGHLHANAWSAALSHWPLISKVEDPVHCTNQSEIARIDLTTRQIYLNQVLLGSLGLEDCLEAVLAHELGHCVRYPGTLATYARLRLLERQIIPLRRKDFAPDKSDEFRDEELFGRNRRQRNYGLRPLEEKTESLRAYQAEAYSFVNLFADVMINIYLGAGHLRDQLVKIYSSLVKSSDKFLEDRPFLFILGLYEEAWLLRPGTLLPRDAASHFKEWAYVSRAPLNYRADAQILVEKLFLNRGNIYSEFLCFLGTVMRYALDGHIRSARPMTNVTDDLSAMPTVEDWAEALTPTVRERHAVDQAVSEDWLGTKDDTKDDETNPAPFRGDWLEGGESERIQKGAIEDRITGLPGYATENMELIPEVMAAYYRKEAARYVIPPFQHLILGDPLVPTNTEEWQIGDEANEIDWMATLLSRGEQLGGAMPLKRIRVPEYEGAETPMYDSRLEMYLDVSGSTPDPRLTKNPLTLAAQILASGTIRSGGAVRPIVYSGSPVVHWPWCRSELELSRFLMHYIGGETRFPFDVLAQSLETNPRERLARVVIADGEFLENMKESAAHEELLSRAIEMSARFFFLLYDAELSEARRLTALGGVVVHVRAIEEFPKVAVEVIDMMGVQSHAA